MGAFAGVSQWWFRAGKATRVRELDPPVRSIQNATLPVMGGVAKFSQNLDEALTAEGARNGASCSRKF